MVILKSQAPWERQGIFGCISCTFIGNKSAFSPLFLDDSYWLLSKNLFTLILNPVLHSAPAKGCGVADGALTLLAEGLKIRHCGASLHHLPSLPLMPMIPFLPNPQESLFVAKCLSLGFALCSHNLEYKCFLMHYM